MCDAAEVPIAFGSQSTSLYSISGWGPLYSLVTFVYFLQDSSMGVSSVVRAMNGAAFIHADLCRLKQQIALSISCALCCSFVVLSALKCVIPKPTS